MMRFVLLAHLLLRRCSAQGLQMSTTEMLTNQLMQGSVQEVSPPSPEVYAEKDAALRKRWEEEGLVRKRRPSKDFNSTLEEMAWTQLLRPACHGEAHRMGARLFAQQTKNATKDTLVSLVAQLRSAVTICEYRCTGGCLHGAMGAFVIAAVDANISLPEIGPTLGHQCVSEPLKSLMTPGECAHALGHALVSSAAGTVDFCDSALKFSTSTWTLTHHNTSIDNHSLWGRALAHYCAGGVFMEDYQRYFKSLELTERVPRCHRADIPATASASCFYYGLRHNWLDLGLQMHFYCGRTDNAITASCIFGAASGATIVPSYRVDLKPAVRRCQAYDADSRLRRACIDGLVFRADKFFANELENICELFDATDDRNFCLAVGRAGMYSLVKAPLLRSYQVDDP